MIWSREYLDWFYDFEARFSGVRAGAADLVSGSVFIWAALSSNLSGRAVFLLCGLAFFAAFAMKRARPVLGAALTVGLSALALVPMFLYDAAYLVPLFFSAFLGVTGGVPRIVLRHRVVRLELDT